MNSARDPFADGAGKALEALRAKWAGVYLVSVSNGTWSAIRSDATGDVITAETPDGLDRALLGANGGVR